MATPSRIGRANPRDMPSRSQTRRHTEPGSPRRNSARTSRSSCTSVAGWSSMKPASCTGVGGVITAVPKPASNRATVTRPTRCSRRRPSGTPPPPPRPRRPVGGGHRRRALAPDGGQELLERRAGRLGERDALALAVERQERERRARVEVERALGADDRELLVGARPRRPAGVHAADGAAAEPHEELGVDLDAAGGAVEERCDLDDVVARDVADDVDDVHAEVDEAATAGLAAVEEPGGSGAPTPGGPRARRRRAGRSRGPTDPRRRCRGRPRTVQRSARSGTARARHRSRRPRRSSRRLRRPCTPSACPRARACRRSRPPPPRRGAARSASRRRRHRRRRATASSQRSTTAPPPHWSRAASADARDRLANAVTSAPTDRSAGRWMWRVAVPQPTTAKRTVTAAPRTRPCARPRRRRRSHDRCSRLRSGR